MKKLSLLGMIAFGGFACMTLATNIVGSDEYLLWSLPPVVREEYKVAQKTPFELNQEGHWVELANSDEVISFADLSSVSLMKNDSYVRAKMLYVFTTTIDVDGKKAKIALRDGIYNCPKVSAVTVSTIYYGSASDNFKQIIPGSPKETAMPRDSIGYDEINKVCALGKVFKEHKSEKKINT